LRPMLLQYVMEKLISILKAELNSEKVTDIIQVGPRELNIVISNREDVKSIRKLAALAHDDSEVKIKGIKVNFVDQYGTRFEQL